MYDVYKGQSCPFQSLQPSSRHSFTDPGGGEITVGGALKWFEDLGVDPEEDVVLLPIAYELKSPTVGSFPREPWVDGWRSLGHDSIGSMKTALPKLRDKLANNPSYFTSVYNYTFEFAKTGAQRSIGVETAIAFWGLLIPYGLAGKALAHTPGGDDGDGGDVSMGTEEGWKPEFTRWWFEFLTTKGGKGVSKDTWTMVGPHPFVRFIPSHHRAYRSVRSSLISSAPSTPSSRNTITNVSLPIQVPYAHVSLLNDPSQ